MPSPMKPNALALNKIQSKHTTLPPALTTGTVAFEQWILKLFFRPFLDAPHSLEQNIWVYSIGKTHIPR
jgi:hypothetical protein